VSDKAEVALHWGGGRHHAHSNRASGFCYVNDVVLGVKKLRRRFSRILYIDIDIHHADGVQDAFYDTNEVMTVSFHRLANGFFPCTGAAKDKGRSNGIGYNLNVIIPRGCDDKNFIQIFKHALTNLLDAYKPDAVVLCVGADGLKDDPLVGNMDGWSLTSEGLAECVRTTSELCQGIKLLLLGGGGYDPVRAARTFLLCTAAACESARPGMLKNELPRDVPRHRHFPRYGPDFRLINESEDSERTKERDRAHELSQARNEIDLATLYLQARANKHHETPQFGAFEDEEDLLGFTYFDKKSSKKGRQRK
jgi:histone deacetylase 8